MTAVHPWAMMQWWVLIYLVICTNALKRVIQIPLRVHLILVGFESFEEGDGSARASLERTLGEVLPSVVPEGSKNLALELTYQVETGDKVFPKILTQYHELVVGQPQSQLQGGGASDVNGEVAVSEADIKTFLHDMAEKHGDMRADFNHLPILVVQSPSLPPHRLLTSTGSLSLVFTGDLLFVDLSASVPGSDVPSGQTDRLVRELTSFVASGVLLHGLGSLEPRHSYYATHVVLPFLVLRNTDLLGAEALKTQHQGLQEWADSLLLPTQSATVLSTNHFVAEHPQISVALSLAEYTRTYTGRQGSLEFSEPVPVIDSQLLSQELSGVGDRILAQLLAQVGHERAAQVAAARPLAAAALRMSSDAEEFKTMFRSSHGKGDKDGRIADGISVVPMVLISDMHRRLNRRAGAGLGGKADGDLDVLPLLDGDDLVQYRTDREVVLALHASDPALVHSMHRKEWGVLPASSLRTIMAAAVTAGLTSLRPTYDTVMATPSNGLLPNWATWHLPNSEGPGKGPAPGVLSWLSRRTAFAARVHEALRVGTYVQDGAQARLTQASDALHVALGLSTSKLELGALSELLPSTCAMHIVWLEDAMMTVTEKMTELQSAIHNFADKEHRSRGNGMHFEDLLDVLDDLERSVQSSARTVLSEGQVLRSQMASCLVELSFTEEEKDMVKIKDNDRGTFKDAYKGWERERGQEEEKGRGRDKGEGIGLSVKVLASQERSAAKEELRQQRNNRQTGAGAWTFKVVVLLLLITALVVMRRLQRQIGDKAKKLH